MTMRATYWIRCDRCGTEAGSGPSRVVASMHARHAGWNLDPRSDADLCGGCWQALMHVLPSAPAVSGQPEADR